MNPKKQNKLFNYTEYSCFKIMSLKTINTAFTLFFLTFFTIFFKAQTPESIEKQLDQAVTLSSQDASLSISLFIKALKESEKINFDKGILKCKESLAILYFNNSEYEKVIKISEDVENLAKKLNNFSTLTGMYRTISASYSMLGLNNQAIQNLDKALTYVKYIEDENIRYYKTALIYDSYSGCLEDMKGSENKILYYVNKSLDELSKIPDEKQKSDILNAKYNVVGIQYIKLGHLYFENFKQSRKAEDYYRKALDLYENQKYQIEPSNKIALFSYISEFYFSEKDYQKSIKYGKEVLKLTGKFDQPELRKEVYNNLFKSYLETGQKEESKYYADLYTQLNDSLKKAERKSVNTSLNKIISENKKDSQKNINETMLIASGFIIFLAVLAYLLWRKNEKKLHKQYKNLIKSIQESASQETGEILSQPEPTGIESDEDQDLEQKSVYITPETVDTLLSGLNKFEKSNRFIKKDVSLGYLINYLGTNSKYLPEILREYKNKSFSQYINDLRIDYIIKLLYNEPKYRGYKIDYLAKECGFSSRNTFTRAFKNKTGMLPSYFIENLDRESAEYLF